MSLLDWVSSLWLSSGSFTGPARNAPNNGIDIKKLFDQRPTQVITLTQEQVQIELKKLRPTKTNAIPPISHKPPIMQEFDDVFNQGYKNYFEILRNKRMANTSLKLEQEVESENIPVTVTTINDDEKSVLDADPSSTEEFSE